MRNNSLTIKQPLFKIFDQLLDDYEHDDVVYDNLKPKIDKFKLKRMGEYSEEDFYYGERIFELEKDIRSIHHLESKYNLHIGDTEMCELYDLRKDLVFKLIDETRRENVKVIEPPLTEKEKEERLKEYKDVSNFIHTHLNNISKS